MNRFYFPILLLFFGNIALGQNGFEKKKRKSEYSPLKENYEIISGKNLNDQAQAKFYYSPLTQIKKIIKDSDNESVIYAENPSYNKTQKQARRNFNDQSLGLIKSLKNELKISDPDGEFVKISEATDAEGLNHIKLQQRFKGINIYGGEVLLHSDKTGIIKFLNGRVFPTPQLDVQPAIPEKVAIEKAYEDVAKTTIIQKNGNLNKLLAIDPDQSELLILTESGKSFLTYHLTIRPNILERWVYFIDAKTGQIIDKYNHTCSLDGVVQASAKDLNGITKAFSVLQIGQNHFMIDATKPMFKNNQSKLPDAPVGAIWTIDGNNSRIDADEMDLSHVVSTNKNIWSPTSVSAHNNASICFDYYSKTHSRNSLNGNGGNIISVINIADEDGKGMDNAYWNGQFMGYGNGKDAFKPLAGALDVAGHEMTHGVIENTAKLEYRNQSGALNESFADIFGAMIDRDDWQLGEDVAKKTAFPSGALRSLENPNQGGKNDPGYQPKNMSQYAYLRDTPSEDNGGVHVNSGIPNHAFYKFATSAGITKDIAEKVFYKALTTYLTRTSKFVDLRLAVIKSSEDLFPSNPQVSAAAKSAFDAVGIIDPTSTGTGGNTGGTTGSESTTIPTNPGSENMVVMDPSDGNIYKYDIQKDDLKLLIESIGLLSKPSVTDDGSYVYFVGANKNIYRKNLTTNETLQKLSELPEWKNVAISKNGKILAAIPFNQEPFIVVFNLETGKSKKFELYNPTYTQGVSTGEVLYPDSFEWDYTGEFLIYDAFNQAKSNFSNIEFWDVGLLRAWDPIKKDFGDGTIEKLFTNLEDGENIGNPTFAKTNTNILAFDYFNSEEEEYYVITVDFGKNSDNIDGFENNTIGYPDFNKEDKFLVFNTEDKNIESIGFISLEADKITPSSDPANLFPGEDGKWAVFYSIGQRALPTKETQTIQITPVTDKQPGTSFDIVASVNSNLPMIFTVVSGDATVNGKRVTLGNTPGKVIIRAIQDGNSKYASATSDVSFCINPPAPRLTDNGQTITASGGTLYQFYVNNNPVGGQTTSNSIKKDFAGNYSVKSVTSDGCFSLTSNIISASALANETNYPLEVSVSPNPIYETVKVKIPETEKLVEINISDQKGSFVKHSKLPEINVGNFSPGIYFFYIKTDKNNHVIKVTKN